MDFYFEKVTSPYKYFELKSASINSISVSLALLSKRLSSYHRLATRSRSWPPTLNIGILFCSFHFIWLVGWSQEVFISLIQLYPGRRTVHFPFSCPKYTLITAPSTPVRATQSCQRNFAALISPILFKLDWDFHFKTATYLPIPFLFVFFSISCSFSISIVSFFLRYKKYGKISLNCCLRFPW